MTQYPSHFVTRRHFLTAGGAFLAAAPHRVFGMDSPRYGGVLRLAVPWALERLDPHDLHNPASALIRSALWDTLYRSPQPGSYIPSLASSIPHFHRGWTHVPLRPGLVSARGHAVTARTALLSLERCRARSGSSLLHQLGVMALHSGGQNTLLFKAPKHVVLRVLSCPVTSIVPGRFSSSDPDGTGPFLFRRAHRRILLIRNPLAARGGSFLDKIQIRSSSSLSRALRSFEAGRSDVGWLGGGLHQAKSSLARFSGPSFGWVILRTGKGAGQWHAPGVASRLASTVSRGALTQLGLHPPGARARPLDPRSAPVERLVVDKSQPHLVEIARAVATSLSQTLQVPVTVDAVPPVEFRDLRHRKAFSMMIDYVGKLGAGRRHELMSLLHADSPARAKHPPRGNSLGLEQLTRTLHLGIVGKLLVEGAQRRNLVGLNEWDLGNLRYARK